jgi:hypothetical protein
LWCVNFFLSFWFFLLVKGKRKNQKEREKRNREKKTLFLVFPFTGTLLRDLPSTVVVR